MKACAAGAPRVDRVVTATDPATDPGGHTRFAALDSLRGIAALGVAVPFAPGAGMPLTICANRYHGKGAVIQEQSRL